MSVILHYPNGPNGSTWVLEIGRGSPSRESETIWKNKERFDACVWFNLPLKALEMEAGYREPRNMVPLEAGNGLQMTTRKKIGASVSWWQATEFCQQLKWAETDSPLEPSEPLPTPWFSSGEIWTGLLTYRMVKKNNNTHLFIFLYINTKFMVNFYGSNRKLILEERGHLANGFQPWESSLWIQCD